MTTPAIPEIVLDEAAARRVLLLHGLETGTADDALWSAEDRAWATRLARETAPAGTAPADFLDQRAVHALQRLGPRDAAVGRALRARVWRPAWVGLALAAGAIAGLAADAIGSGQHIDLLAPPVWAVVVWNLAVYVALLLPRPTTLQRWLARRLSPAAAGRAGLQGFHAAWLRQAGPLLAARAALLLHAAAAALALGLIGGLYLRGLVLDYRAGWQSTFLDAAQVRAVLALLLAPAQALTGIAVPDATALQAMRVVPGVAASATAAPWIHLYAATLAAWVVLPRLGLAAWAGWRSRRLSRALPLALEPLYVQRLVRAQAGTAAAVQVLPHGAAPAPAAVAALRRLLAGALGDATTLQVAAPTAYGDEDDAPPAAPPDTALRLLLVELSATPEDDTHGRWLQTLRAQAPATPLLVVADEHGFRARFAGTPARVAERRASWQRWAQAQGVGFFGFDPQAADAPGAAAGADAGRALQAALAH